MLCTSQCKQNGQKLFLATRLLFNQSYHRALAYCAATWYLESNENTSQLSTEEPVKHDDEKVHALHGHRPYITIGKVLLCG